MRLVVALDVRRTTRSDGRLSVACFVPRGPRAPRLPRRYEAWSESGHLQPGARALQLSYDAAPAEAVKRAGVRADLGEFVLSSAVTEDQVRALMEAFILEGVKDKVVIASESRGSSRAPGAWAVMRCAPGLQEA